MYGDTHGTTGIILTTSTVALLTSLFPNNMAILLISIFIGSVFGFISHFLWDYVQEYNYGATMKWIKAQIPSYIVFLIALLSLFITHHYLFLISFIVGYIAGNLPDIIDKGIWFLKGRNRNDMFSCHNGESIFFKWRGKKLGYPTLISISKSTQTKFIIISSTILALFTLLLIW